MARAIIIFFLLWLVALLGLATWRSWTWKGAADLSKTIGLAGLAAVAASIILGLIVAIF